MLVKFLSDIKKIDTCIQNAGKEVMDITKKDVLDSFELEKNVHTDEYWKKRKNAQNPSVGSDKFPHKIGYSYQRYNNPLRKLLNFYGRIRSSISYELRKNNVTITVRDNTGSPINVPKLMNEGGINENGRKVPARTFLGFSKKSKEKIINQLLKKISNH